MGADVRAKVDERWVSPRRELGPCLVWREGEATIKAAGNEYGRLYDPTLKRSDAAHLVVWRRCFPDKPIPSGWTIDHACYVTLCQRPDHLRGPITRAENTRRRHQRVAASPPRRAPDAVERFAVALFVGVSRPRVRQRALELDKLVALLTTFEILTDKRLGRCWSPTAYVAGCSTRSNNGVASVSTLVFDLDRMPPNPGRLGDVCWIAHTTWSYTAEAPRWRLVVPLAEPVRADSWSMREDVLEVSATGPLKCPQPFGF
jgi:HNH endonuclease